MASFQVATDLSSTVTLNDGVVMPLFGLGCWKAEKGSIAEEAVLYALKNGYRLIDTAEIYGNESDVGKGIKRSGVSRDKIFLVTKVFNNNHGYDLTVESVKQSLARLDTPYIDLHLVHSPLGGKNVETYRALQDLKAKGLIRSVGVSNFGVHHLEGLREAGLPLPSVNQIELHAFYRQDEIVKYCREHGIAVMGYSPLAQGRKQQDPDLIRIAQRLKKTVAQVLIRWSVQNGYITIPKSTTPERILENAGVFDFALTKEDIEILNSKPEGVVTWYPTVMPWEA